MQGAFRCHDTDIHRTLFPDTVIRQQGFVFIHTGREAFGEILDKIEHGTLTIAVQAINIRLAVPFRFPVLRHVVGQIPVDTTRSIIGGMQACAGNCFVAVHQVFALAEGVQEHRHGTNVEPVCAQPQQVIEDTRDLIEHDTDVLRTLRHVDTQQFFDGHNVGVFVAHHRHIIEPVHVTDALVIRFAFGQLLGSAMQ